MESLHHISKLEMLVISAATRELVMRGEEVQRHITPVVAFLRIALKNRHQLNNGYPQILQIWDLLHQTRISARSRWIHTGVTVFREAPHVKFVDDRIRFVMR